MVTDDDNDYDNDNTSSSSWSYSHCAARNVRAIPSSNETVGFQPKIKSCEIYVEIFMKSEASDTSKAFSVTSLEDERVSLIQKNGSFLVSKKTTISEPKNLARVKSWLKMNGNLSGLKTGLHLNISIPKVMEWKISNSTLVMEYCCGVNLETELIKNDKNRDLYIKIISDLLHWIKEKSFYWQDFAPRNMLFNKESNTVTLIDFESRLKIGRKMMSEKEFNLFIQNRIILELATVLFAAEQKYLCPNIWKYSRRTSIPLGEIIGRRRRGYILFHHPGIYRIKHSDLVQIEKRIVYIATPFYYKNTVFYPLIALSKIDSVDKYIKTVSELEVKEKSSWPEIINEAACASG